jgi:hypothetical protein
MNKVVLMGILTVLAILALVGTPDKPDSTSRSRRVLENLSPEQISQINIQTATGQGITLSSHEKTWTLDSMKGFPADPSKVADFLQNLFLLPFGDSVTRGEKLFDQYGLSFGPKLRLGTLVSLHSTQGKTLAALIFGNSHMAKGKYGFDVPSGQYFRQLSEDSIYLLKDELSFDKKTEDWIQKKIPSIQKDQVQQIRMGKGGPQDLTLIRLKKESPLKLPKLESMEEMNTTEVDSLQTILEDFSFSSLEPRSSKAATESLTHVEGFEITTFDGIRLSIGIGVKTTANTNRYLTLSWEGLNADKESVDQVEAWNARFATYAIGISDWSAKKFLKLRADLIQSRPLGAKHILISFKGASNSKSKLPKEEALGLAQDLIRQLTEGKDFGELAKQHSTDLSNKAKGGDLGTFASGDMVKPFEEATLALAIGEVTESPIETVFGYHVIKRTQ